MSYIDKHMDKLSDIVMQHRESDTDLQLLHEATIAH